MAIFRKLSMEDLDRISVEDFRELEKNPITIILDDIRSAHNVGSFFRTADAFRIQKIFLCGITATPPNKEIQKTALGATESVCWEYCKDVDILLDELNHQGYHSIAVEQAENAIMLPDFKPEVSTPIALVFGNEVHGVSEKALGKCANCIEIPQWGTKHSLNVSVAGGIVLWDTLNLLKITNEN